LKERRIKWMIRGVARREGIQGRRVRMGQKELWIEGMWWRWERDELRDERKRSWEEVNGIAGKKQETKDGEEQVRGNQKQCE